MAQLKENHSDGDILYAGTTSDVDKLNGITNRINDHTHDGTDTAAVPWANITGKTADVMYASSGSESISSETTTTLDTYTAGAGDWAADDRILIYAELDQTGGGGGSSKIRMNVTATNANSLATDVCSTGEYIYAEFSLSQSGQANTAGIVTCKYIITGDVIWNDGSGIAPIRPTNWTANWITTAFTIDFQEDSGAGSNHTTYWKWKVVKLKG